LVGPTTAEGVRRGGKEIEEGEWREGVAGLVSNCFLRAYPAVGVTVFDNHSPMPLAQQVLTVRVCTYRVFHSQNQRKICGLCLSHKCFTATEMCILVQEVEETILLIMSLL